MEVLLGGIVLFGMCVLSMGVLLKMVSQKYPPVKIEVWDRGFSQDIQYRLWGYTIVKDNLFKLLMNEFEICGDIRLLEFRAVKGMLGSFGRKYYAIRRYDFLFGLKQIDLADGMKITDAHPQLHAETADGKSVKVEITKEGMLFPFKMFTANEGLQEIEVTNVKGIAARLADAIKTTKAYIEATNPLITMLMYSVPLVLIVLSIGLVLYLILTGVSDNVLEIAKLNNQTASMMAGCMP